MQGNFYATAQDARMGRLSKYEWSRFVGTRFNDQSGLAATLLHLPQEPIMTHAFKVGDKLTISRKNGCYHAFEEGTSVVVKHYDGPRPHDDTHAYVVVAKHPHHAGDDLEQIVYECDLKAAEFTGQFDAIPEARVSAFKSEGFAERVAADKAEKRETNSAFLTARQKAWDDYAYSRASRSLACAPNGSRKYGFNEGYTQGFSAGKQAERTFLAAGGTSTVHVASARITDPATSHQAAATVSRKAGKIADLVLQALNDGAFTGKELSARTGVPLNSVTPRFAQLRRAGMIHAVSGKGGETVWALGNGVAA